MMPTPDRLGTPFYSRSIKHFKRRKNGEHGRFRITTLEERRFPRVQPMESFWLYLSYLQLRPFRFSFLTLSLTVYRFRFLRRFSFISSTLGLVESWGLVVFGNSWVSSNVFLASAIFSEMPCLVRSWLSLFCP